jgi:hypothetical protein
MHPLCLRVYEILKISQILYYHSFQILPQLTREEVSHLSQVLTALDQFIMILGLPGQDSNPVKQLLKTGSEQICVALPHSQQLVLYLVAQGSSCSRDILKREVLNGFHGVS